MRYFYFLISFVLLFCVTSYTQTICIFPTLKSEGIKLDEFTKLDTLQSNDNPLQVIRYTAYLVSDKENNTNYNSTKQEVIKVTVNSNSLKHPIFLKELNKFSPPF